MSKDRLNKMRKLVQQMHMRRKPLTVDTLRCAIGVLLIWAGGLLLFSMGMWTYTNPDGPEWMDRFRLALLCFGMWFIGTAKRTCITIHNDEETTKTHVGYRKT